MTKEIESEGYDRKNASLPECQIELINEISKVNPNIIVVLENGSVVELPFINQIRGCIECYLGGEGINEAILRVLYGKVNPSGRLSETFFSATKGFFLLYTFVTFLTSIMFMIFLPILSIT